MFGRKNPDGQKTALRQGERRLDVQGTFAYEDAVLRAKKKHRHGNAVGVLVPVTEGRYKGAVSVCIDATQLGSLPKETAPEYFPVVMDLKKKRKRATVMLDFADSEIDYTHLTVTVIADPAAN